MDELSFQEGRTRIEGHVRRSLSFNITIRLAVKFLVLIKPIGLAALNKPTLRAKDIFSTKLLFNSSFGCVVRVLMVVRKYFR